MKKLCWLWLVIVVFAAGTAAFISAVDSPESLPRQQTSLTEQRPPEGFENSRFVRKLAQAQGGTEVQAAFQSLAKHKTDALPVVKDRLRNGEMIEKFMLTKFLRYCPWPETRDDLVALARDNKQHWLPRQGALADRTAGLSLPFTCLVAATAIEAVNPPRC